MTGRGPGPVRTNRNRIRFFATARMLRTPPTIEDPSEQL
jgi:hypothetical protein